MTDSKVQIIDYKTLIHLKDAMDYCGDSLLKLLKEVEDYLQSCLSAFEQQRDIIKEELDLAEQELNQAQQSLSCCESSQEWDEEAECYRPSCNSEKSHVESARQRYTEFKEKYDKACRIVSDCKYEIEQYKKPFGIISPAGGEKTLENLAEQHTSDGVRKMNEILEIVVTEYLGRSIHETNEMESPQGDKVKQFEAASEKVKAKQEAVSSYNNIADANVSMLCSGCKRPIPICICQNIRQR